MIGTLPRLVRSATMMTEVRKEVLVVEDRLLVRMMAADALEDHGFVCMEAADAHEALETLKQHPSISLLFTDVDMPGGMNGLELARRVHSERSHVELLVTSGAVTIADKDLPDHGTFLQKPYTTERLVQIVSGKLEGRR